MTAAIPVPMVMKIQQQQQKHEKVEPNRFRCYEFGYCKLFHNNLSYIHRIPSAIAPQTDRQRNIFGKPNGKKATSGNNIEFAQVDQGPSLITKYEKKGRQQLNHCAQHIFKILTSQLE